MKRIYHSKFPVSYPFSRLASFLLVAKIQQILPVSSSLVLFSFYMKKSLIVAIVLGMIAVTLGVLAYIQRSQIIALKGQLVTSGSLKASSDQSPEASIPGAVVTEKSIRAGGSDVSIQYLCFGEIKEGVGEFKGAKDVPSYCVGSYELVALIGDSSVSIGSGQATSGKDAPILSKIKAFGPRESMLLISFKPSCTATGDCGLGMPMNSISFVFSSEDFSSRAISHFPEQGTPIWNALATKALFIPDTCGGGGCSTLPVLGYDIEKDEERDVTTEVAVGLGEDGKPSDAMNVFGDRLPSWKSVEWNGADAFTAIFVDVDGTQKEVKGVF